jgi:hypothetical protein
LHVALSIKVTNLEKIFGNKKAVIFGSERIKCLFFSVNRLSQKQNVAWTFKLLN